MKRLQLFLYGILVVSVTGCGNLGASSALTGMRDTMTSAMGITDAVSSSDAAIEDDDTISATSDASDTVVVTKWRRTCEEYYNEKGLYSTTTYTYDDNGSLLTNICEYTDGRSSTTTYTTDAYGNIERSITSGMENRFYRDAAGTLLGQMFLNDNYELWAAVVSDYGDADNSEQGDADNSEQGDATYDENGQLIRLLESHGETQTLHEYEYDDHQNVIVQRNIYLYGTDNEAYNEWRYTYEEMDCTVPAQEPAMHEQKVCYNKVMSDNSGYSESIQMAYDSYGNLVLEYNKDYNEYRYYEYDDNQMLLRRTSSVHRDDYDPQIMTVTYDEQGNEIRDDFTSGETGELEYYIECVNNEEGQVVRKDYHSDNEYFDDMDGLYSEYEYTDSGNIAFRRDYEADGSLRNTMECQYDAEGNEITRIGYDSRGNVAETSEFYYTTIYVYADAE